ncbi:protein abrupt [Eurytemora carolleeae]|uniref:protein abrupt n=1 Tax=Eurytemora carolleeae TaxID=1294199 RepID=UPI000C77C999|nr:protein abrupt [Eurytemora carolleeae]|eukprot:XP_023322519.1 protein abrupt-like [Eurytemora affinis]
MASNQKYSLRWNDFSVNVASTFRDLHSRQDFVDVTLACADGSTLDAHKVILSSVSTYFRDILKNAPCKHPIIILKDTCREEASAMLEFAYTGEVNVGQDLLPSLLHTAKCFKIKGLDNVQTPPGLLDLNTSHSNDHESEHWGGSRPPTRPHTPSTRPHTPQTRSHTPSTRPHTPQSHPHSPNSVHSSQDRHAPDQTQDVKPFLDYNSDIKPFSDHFLVGGPGSARAPGSLPSTRPSTPSRPSSPTHSSRTPPHKRWKRSFDMSRGDECDESGLTQNSNDFGEPEAKRFCDAKRFSTDSERQFMEADSNTRRFAEPRPIPHSMPASPTMLDHRNFSSLGLLRHLARLEEPREAHENSRIDHNNRLEESIEQDALDYRFQVANQTEVELEKEKARHERLAFRPESAPTVLDMSPDTGSRHSIDGIHKQEHDERLVHFRNIVVGNIQPVSSLSDNLSDCLNKSMMGGGSGRYSCDECGKLFRHPGSLQHHRHIHRGTHRCPSCGKAFSRRWDMERHLNKSKYGCPANRFSSPGSQEPESPNEHSLLPSPSHHSMINNSSSQHSLLAILPHSHQQLNTN